MALPTTGQTFSGQTAAAQGNLGMTTTIIPVSINVTTTPLSRKVTLGVLSAFLAATAFLSLNVHAQGFTGPLTGAVTGNVTGNVTGDVTGNLTGDVTGNVFGNVSGSAGTATLAASATKLATARAINGVDFDGTAPITVTAAAGTLTGTTLNATVVTSSLTAIGTLVAGAVPASLVTAGTFPAGAFAFTNDITVHGVPFGLGPAADATNIRVGTGALASAGAGTENVAIGQFVLGPTTSNQNTAIGWASAGNIIGGAQNTVVGASALQSETTGSSNAIFGFTAANNVVGGSNNTILGCGAFRVSIAGSQNTVVGSESVINGANRNVTLGYFSGHYETGSDAFYVDNQDRTNTAGDKAGALLYGTFNATAASQTLAINAGAVTLLNAAATDQDATATNTRLLLYTVDTGTVQRVKTITNASILTLLGLGAGRLLYVPA